MHFGIFVGLGTVGAVLGWLILIIIACILLYVVFFTQVGLIVLAVLIIYGLYRLFRSN